MTVDRHEAFGRVSSASEAAQRLLNRPLTEGDLADQTAEVARPLDEGAGDRISVLVVECGGERLAMPGSLVRRVALPAIVHRVPHRSNAVLRGICNIGGQLALAADLAALLDLERPPGGAEDRARRMLLLGDGAEQWVIEVDRVIGVVRVDPARLLDPPATVRAARDRLTEHLVEIDLSGGSDGGDGGGGTVRMALLSGSRLLEGLGRSLA